VVVRGGILWSVVASLVLASCAMSPAGDQDAVSYYFEQRVVWKDCEFGAQCSTIRAPLNWDELDAFRDIELAVVRHRARGEAQGSLFVNPGGPGASGFDFVQGNPSAAAGVALQEAFDIVGWDPRGVNRSSAVSCAKNDSDLDYFFFGELEAKPGSPEWEAELLEESIRFGQECAKNTGELLEFVDTMSTVRDLELLRHLLGDEQLNYLGYSYGTLIGALYIETFPERVGRMVLDGPVDPSASQFDLVVNQHRGFENALVAYFEFCDSAGFCPFPGSLTSRLESVSALYDRLELEPLRHSDGRMLDDSMFRTAMVTTLYSQQNWSFLTQLFTEVSQDQTDTAMFLVDFYYDRLEGVYQDNSMEAFIAINCLDYPVESDKGVLAEQAKQLREAAPYTARPKGYGDLVCQNWPFPPRLEKGPVRGAGANPVVILGTTGDPATPYNWSVSLAEQLENASLLTYVGEGHLAYRNNDPCINGPVDEYFLTGVVPPNGLRCES
jgi:pimeloyl-ACP methyl ester carboxylesterase